MWCTEQFCREVRYSLCFLSARREVRRLLGVSRNAYYRYCQRQRERLPNVEHEAMIEAVKEVTKSSDKSYGARRMKHALNALGYPVGRQKARSLMREADVKARYRKKFKVTTNSDHKQPQSF